MLSGIDVSAHEGIIDWEKVKQAGHSFVYVRAAYGTKADVNLMRNLDGARAAGLPVGIYHFLRTTRDYQEQIDLFLELLDSCHIGPGDLPPSLDVEDNPNFDGPWDPANNAAYLGALSRWIEAVRAKTHAHPVLYTRAGFWEVLGNPKGFSDCPLWVASYRPAPPKLPVSWQRYTFWQYDEHGVLDGIADHVDLNYFDGGKDELKALLLP